MHDLTSDQLNLDPKITADRLLQKAHNRDGLPEMAAGLTFLGLAILIFFQSLQPVGSVTYRSLALAMALIIPALGLCLPWAVKHARRHYLIRRFGYLETKPIGLRPLLFGLSIAATFAAVLAATRFSIPDQWILAGSGIFGGALAAFCGRARRFVLHGVLVAGAGLMIAQMGVTLLTGFPLLFGFAGALHLVSGIVVFARFVRFSAEQDR